MHPNNTLLVDLHLWWAGNTVPRGLQLPPPWPGASSADATAAKGAGRPPSTTVKGNADNSKLATGNQLNLLLCEIPEGLDWPCSVRLVGTLTCAQTGTNGITVSASQVSIDLAGLTLEAPGTNSGAIPGDSGGTAPGSTNPNANYTY